MSGSSDRTVLRVRDLCLEVRRGADPVASRLLDTVNMHVPAVGITCILGASGAGKSVLVRTLLGLLPQNVVWLSGELHLVDHVRGSRNLLEGLTGKADAIPMRVELERRFSTLRGEWLGFVAQHAHLALEPSRTVAQLLQEAIRLRSTAASLRSCREEAAEWLQRLGLEPGEVLERRAQALSGGMAQRVAVAAALARGARVVFFDEPTAGLDAENTKKFVRLMESLHQQSWLDASVLVTHQVDLVAALAQHLVVVDRGTVVEEGNPARMLEPEGAAHATTRRWVEGHRRLFQTRAGRRAEVGNPESGFAVGARSAACLKVEGLSRRFGQGRWSWRRLGGQSQEVLRELELGLYPGEVLGLQGTSGAGKSTLAACLVGALRPDAGRILLDGAPLQGLASHDPARWSRIQLVHQPVDAALHPRMTALEGALETARELLGLRGRAALRCAEEALEQVGLTSRRDARPAQLSGGELRRVGLARALMVRPKVLIADEPTAGTDPALRAELLDLLLAQARGPNQMAILLISHDPQVLSYAADRLVWLEHGRLQPRALRSLDTSAGEPMGGLCDAS